MPETMPARPGRMSQRMSERMIECQIPSGKLPAIENGHLEWIYPLKIAIFHSYVGLPEGRMPEKMPEKMPESMSE